MDPELYKLTGEKPDIKPISFVPKAVSSEVSVDSSSVVRASVASTTKTSRTGTISTETKSDAGTGLVDYLKSKGIEAIDKRPKGGALWIVGDQSLDPIIQEMKQKFGARWIYKPEGGIPDYLKEVMETLPWIRVSKILSESLDELVDELTVFIFELVSANGNDIGETVKYIIRELDTMNYNLFRGSCLNMLDTGLIRNNYLNRRDIAIDVGIVTLIKLLMEYIGLEEIQNSNVQELKEYFSEEKRSDFENRLRKEGIEESKITQEADKLERSEYLSSQKDSILYMLNKNSVSNAMEAVIISGRKWESIVERIKNDTFDVTEEIGKYYESHKISGVDKDTWVGVHKMPESIENYVTSNYVDHYENILREKKQLREKVDSMIGQILVELFSKVQR